MLPRPMLTLAGSVLLFCAHDALATAQRTFVASNGIETNPCSLTQPCRSFAAAITQTNVGGEVIVLDSAGYGPVTITKSVSLIAPTGIYAGISVFSGKDGVTVNAPGAIVVLRGLSINGQGGDNGITLKAAARMRVENCVVSAMHVAGISHTAANAELIVLDTIVRDNLGSGVYLFADLGSLVLDHVRSAHNGGNGVSLTPSAGSPGALATITESVFTHNEGDGIGADSISGSTITLLVDRSVISNNGFNGFRATVPNGGSGVASVSRSAVNDNGGNGIFMQGPVLGTASENVVHRNGGAGILAFGNIGGAVYISVNANVGTNRGDDFRCSGPGNFASNGNNLVAQYTIGCTLVNPPL